MHRLLLCTLGRRNEDDRDHFGNKRMDLAVRPSTGLMPLCRKNKPYGSSNGLLRMAQGQRSGIDCGIMLSIPYL